MSQDFLEKAILVMLPIAFTGLLVPVIKNYLDNNNFRKRSLFEAALSRQTKIIEAQSKFLEDISEQLWKFRYLRQLWKFRYLSMAVVFYKVKKDEKLYQVALTKYESENWDIFNRTRVEISRARRLVSETAHRRLVTFYHDGMNGLDKWLRRLLYEKPPVEEWEKLHVHMYEDFTVEIDDLIHALAEELKLTQGQI
jgi:hypothetical protein